MERHLEGGKEITPGREERDLWTRTVATTLGIAVGDGGKQGNHGSTSPRRTGAVDKKSGLPILEGALVDVR